MNESRISVRYARAVFETALEKDLVEETGRDMQVLLDAAGSVEFREFTDNPTIAPSVKTAIFNKAFTGHISPFSLSAATIVIKNGREKYLAAIARFYISLARQHLGLTRVILSTATENDARLLAKIKDQIEKAFSTRVEMETVTDPSLIGGFIIRIDDRLFDASVRKKLQIIRKDMAGS
ncbi:MAG: ATP synthase F1 subunit delta [Bacteroidetes bacterium]|nr:ATP synthase F1 subunit delta [Bacteroidota bacterium]